MPKRQRGDLALFENVAAVETALVVEVVVDRFVLLGLSVQLRLPVVARACSNCGVDATKPPLVHHGRMLRVIVVVVTLALPAVAAAGYLDIHVHTAGIGGGGSGAFVNEEMRDSLRFPIYLRAFGVSLRELEQEGDALVIARISDLVAGSKAVDRAVVLAMDGVVDAAGNLNREATQVYVPNEFVAAETARYGNLCFGASVNPYRRDAIDRLRRARAAGALLVKWIPNIMGIDPADPALRPFYKELVALGLPLLSHAGRERSFATAADELGDPLRLALPLAMGVQVIAAHIAAGGENEGIGNFERVLPLFERYPDLYADISSLTQINRLGYLKRALSAPGVDARLVYGTDWPLQFFPLVSPYYHANHIGWATANTIAAIDNSWDRDVALKKAVGAPEHVFTRSASLLAAERCD